MNLVTDVFQNPVTYAILILIYGLIAFIIIKFKVAANARDKSVWMNFFEFVCGSMSFVFFTGYGAQALSNAFGDTIQVDYNLQSLVTIIFLIVYIVILYKTFNKIVNNLSWRWFGILCWAGGCGMIVNSIFTGGRYIPFIGSLISGGS